jgi:hypothetical protein
MASTHAVDQQCTRELEFLRQRLKDLKAGRLKFSSDGYFGPEPTAEEITHTEALIRILEHLTEKPSEESLLSNAR